MPLDICDVIKSFTMEDVIIVLFHIVPRRSLGAQKLASSLISSCVGPGCGDLRRICRLAAWLHFTRIKHKSTPLTRNAPRILL